MSKSDVLDMDDRDRESVWVVDTEDRGKGVVVGAAVDILGSQSQLVAAQHNCGMNVDGVEARLLRRNELFGVLEGEDLGSGVRGLGVVQVGRRKCFAARVWAEDVVAVLACHDAHGHESCC